MGNMMLNHLGGGPGGMSTSSSSSTGPMDAFWKALGSPMLTPEVQKKLIDSVHVEAGFRTIEELEAERDEVLLGLIEFRTRVQSDGGDESDNELVPRDRKSSGGMSSLSSATRLLKGRWRTT